MDKVARPDVVLGQHVFIGAVPIGHVAGVPGAFMSTSVNVDITMFGEGSPGSGCATGWKPDK